MILNHQTAQDEVRRVFGHYYMGLKINHPREVVKREGSGAPRERLEDGSVNVVIFLADA